MALKIKVIPMRLPNVETDGAESTPLVEDIEDQIKKRLVDGYTLLSISTTDGIVLLVFKKET